MEFKYLNGQNRRTTSPPPCPLSDVAYVSRYPLRGYQYVPGSFSGNVSAPRDYPTAVPVNAEEVFQQELQNEQIRRELEKVEIKREIIAGEMALARRRELEEELRREIASERALRIPMQRLDGISFNNYKAFPGTQIHSPSNRRFHDGRTSTQINRDQLIHLARPNTGHCGGKRKGVTPTVDDSESLQKKVKLEWSCELCQITATSEKGLNDHIQGKKHKAKAFRRTHKIGKSNKTSFSLKKTKHWVKCPKAIATMNSGLYSRPDGQTLHPCLTPAHTGKLESKEKDQDVHKSEGLVGLDNQNETTTSNEAGEANAH